MVVVVGFFVGVCLVMVVIVLVVVVILVMVLCVVCGLIMLGMFVSVCNVISSLVVFGDVSFNGWLMFVENVILMVLL